MRSLILQQLKYKGPEWYFLLLLLAGAYTPPFSFNPLFLIPIGILIVQIIVRSSTGGLILASVIFVLNLGFLAAVLSEFHEFSVAAKEAKVLLLVGLTIGFFNLIMVGLMCYNYTQTKTSGLSQKRVRQPK